MTIKQLKKIIDKAVKDGKGEYVVEKHYWSRAGLEKWEISELRFDDGKGVVSI